MTDTLEELKRVAEAALTTPWHAGHLCDDTHSCNCRYVLAEHMMGAVCEVFVQDGTPETEHKPPLKEAKANQRFIATFDPPTVLSLLHRVETAEARAEVREAMGKEVKALVGYLRARAAEHDEVSKQAADRIESLWVISLNVQARAEAAERQVKEINDLCRAAEARAETAEREKAEAAKIVDGLAWLSEKVNACIDPGGHFDVRGLRDALLAERARAETAERERDEAKADRNAHAEHVRRMAAECEDGLAALEHIDACWEAFGVPSNRGHLSLAEQISATNNELDAAQATITSLQAQLAEAQDALAPFKAVAELMRPLGAFENWPDDKEPSTFMPGAWPCWAAFRRAAEVSAALRRKGK